MMKKGIIMMFTAMCLFLCPVKALAETEGLEDKVIYLKSEQSEAGNVTLSNGENPTFTDEEADSNLPYGEISEEAYQKLVNYETINVITTTQDGQDEVRVTLTYYWDTLVVTGAMDNGILTKFFYQTESNGAFGQISKIEMNNISIIDSYALSNDNYENLHYVTLDKTSTHYFRPYAFYHTYLYKFNFGSQPTYLYDKAFSSPLNEKLDAVMDLPTYPVYVDEGAFFDCASVCFVDNKSKKDSLLKFVRVDDCICIQEKATPNDCTLLAYSYVYDNRDITSINFDAITGEIRIGKYFGMNMPSRIESVSLYGLVTVSEGAFKGNNFIKNINASFSKIERNAFEGCENLEGVGPVYGTVGEEAFKGCTRLKKIALESKAEIGNRAFEGCSNLVLLRPVYGTVGEEAFKGCTGLETVDIKSEAGIGNKAFEGCSKLSTVNMEKVTVVREEAFKDCTGLETVDIKSEAGIGNRAFEGCSKLSSVNMEKVTAVGEEAFKGCTGLETVKAPSATEVGSGAFHNCTNLIDVELTNASSIGNDIFSIVKYPYSLTYNTDKETDNTVINFDFSSAENVEFLKPVYLEKLGIGSVLKLKTGVRLPSFSSAQSRRCTLITSDGAVEFQKKFVTEDGQIYKGGAKTKTDSTYRVVGYGALTYETRLAGEADFEPFNAQKYNKENVLTSTKDNWGGTQYYDIGSKISLKKASVNGYEDSEWYLDKELTKEVTTLENVYLGDNVTLYKEFVPSTYKAYLNPYRYFIEGEEGLQIQDDKLFEEADMVTFQFGELLASKISVVPHLKGYLFTGWYEENGEQLAEDKYYDSDVKFYSSWSRCENHEYDEGVVKVPSTCVKKGTKVCTCKKCGETKEEELELDPKNHPEEQVYAEMTNIKKATCKEEGYTGDSYCLACHKVVAEDGKVIPKTEDHVRTLVGKKDATENAEGYTGDEVCAVCGKVFTKGSIIPKHPKKDKPVITVEIKVIDNGNYYQTDDGKYTVRYMDKTVTLIKGKDTDNATTYTVPDTVVIYGDTFKVTGVGTGFMEGNRTVKTVRMGSNVSVIGKKAFKGCKALKTVQFGRNTTKIANSAFEGCKGLKKVAIPATVTEIGKKAFYNCTNLKKITIKGKSLKKVGKKAFAKTSKKTTIKVPKSKKKAYEKLLRNKCDKTTQIK